MLEEPKVLFYCQECNQVYSKEKTGGFGNKCKHDLATITPKQYIDWVLAEKKVLPIQKKKPLQKPQVDLK